MMVERFNLFNDESNSHLPRWIVPKVSLGVVVQTLLLIIAATMVWANMQSQIAETRALAAANTQAIKLLAEGQTKQNEVLQLIVQRLEDYPLHIHSDGNIVYPKEHSDKNNSERPH